MGQLIGLLPILVVTEREVQLVQLGMMYLVISLCSAKTAGVMRRSLAPSLVSGKGMRIRRPSREKYAIKRKGVGLYYLISLWEDQLVS